MRSPSRLNNSRVNTELIQKSIAHLFSPASIQALRQGGWTRTPALFSFHSGESVFLCGGNFMAEKSIIICTRGSALALAQSNLIAAQCQAAFPRLHFELKIIKTTGDKLQKASLAKIEGGLPKGLFTKELEVALLQGQADLAVHSLKDLPTDLPAGLVLAATPQREDVRDVLIYRSAQAFENRKPKTEKSPDRSPGHSALRGFKPHLKLKDFPKGATMATSSTRRKMSLLAVRPDFNIVEIRGNVATRLQKVAERGELDATILALAGMTRLHFNINADGTIHGDPVPEGLSATVLDLDEMLPCVGQGAIGIETRADDERVAKICERLNHRHTFQAVTAERAFLRGMGGGCQSPVGAYAEVSGDIISLQAISFRDEQVKRGQAQRPFTEAALLGEQIARELK
jgi:hydroxymethylbilane synthase